MSDDDEAPAPTAVVDPASTKHHFVVYALFFFGDDVVRYIGLTKFQRERAKQHYACMSGAPRVIQARIAYGECRSKVVAGLYATLREAQALETYLMTKHKTILKEKEESIEMRLSDQNPKRLPWPDVSLYPAVPASAQLNCRPSVSLKKHYRAVHAASKAYEAGETPPPDLSEEERAELHALIASHWAGEEWLTAGDADDPCGLVFDVDSPFARARELKEDYEAMAAHTRVDRELVAGELYTLRHHSLGDAEADAEVAGMVRLWQQTVHPDKARLKEQPLTAGYAASLFSLAYEWCGEFEEGLLLKEFDMTPEKATKIELSRHRGAASTELNKYSAIIAALQWRRWSEAHDGAAPKHTGATAAVQPEEAKLAQAMGQWRNGHGGAARRHQSLYLLLLRHHAWFAHYVRGEFATGGTAATRAKDVNQQLQLGFGTRAEVQAGTAARIIRSLCDVCGAKNVTSHFLHGFLGGSSADLANVLLAPGGALTPARAAALRAIHEGNVEVRKARGQASAAKRKAAREANGRATKTQATDEGPSSA